MIMKSLMTPFLILLILAGCASKPSPNLCASVCNGLVAYYPFDGDATDKSGNGHDGKVIGSTLTKNRNGYRNHAYHFDGKDDYIEIGGLDQSLINKNGFTYFAIVKISAIDQERIRKLSDDDHPYQGPIIFDSKRQSQLQFSFERNKNYIYLWAGESVPSNKINPLIYNTIVGTYDNKNHRTILYINGEKKREKILKPSLSVPSKYFFGINNPSWKDSPKLHGVIDEIRIYNRALSAEEVKELFLFTSAFPPAE